MTQLTAIKSKTQKLISSFLIKIREVPFQMEKRLSIQHNYSVSNKQNEWKFYLNISGEYHFTNKDISIYVKALDENRKLTKDLLNTYPLLREELLKFGEFYNNLITEYPKDITLIKGIMLPVENVDEAIKAKDGTILTHNKKLIEDNEYNLLEELEDYNERLLSRWYNYQYTVLDNLYLAKVMATLTTKLVLKTMNIRFSNIFTDKVNSDYMDLFFESHLNLKEDISILDDKVKMWLYKNVRRLERNTGRNKTLKEVIDKIFTPSGVGVGEMVLINKDLPSLDNDDVNKPLLIDNKAFLSKPLNDAYIINRNNITSPLDLLKKQIASNEPEAKMFEDESIFYGDSLVEEMKKNRRHTEKSKILELDDRLEVKLKIIPELHILMDTWITMTMEDKLDNLKVSFTDINTNETYSLNSKQGILYLLKVIANLHDVEDKPLDVYVAHSSLDTSTNVLNINNLSIDPETTLSVTEAINGFMPLPPLNIDKVEDFTEYLMDIGKLNNKIWQMSSNANNMCVSSYINYVNERLYPKKEIDFRVNNTTKTIDELLAINGLTLNLPNGYKHITVIKSLIKTFTGLEINNTDEVQKISEKFSNILKKLSSYTIDVIYNKTHTSNLEAPYNQISLSKLINPIVNFNDCYLKPNEPFIWSISHYSDNIKNITKELYTFPEISLDREKGEMFYTGLNNSLSMTGEISKKEIGFTIDPMFVMYRKNGAFKPFVPQVDFTGIHEEEADIIYKVPVPKIEKNNLSLASHLDYQIDNLDDDDLSTDNVFLLLSEDNLDI